MQPDSLVPDPANPLDWDRYQYVLANPVKYFDPSGHADCIDDNCAMVEHPISGTPILRSPEKLPEVVAYIFQEMRQNSAGNATKTISLGNRVYHSGFSVFALFGLLLSWSIWTSQVMDASIQKYLGPFSQFIANWDHKQNISTMDPTNFRSDIWSNIHYGYVGAAAGFYPIELTAGAGVEQIGTNLSKVEGTSHSSEADNWFAGWDDPSDNNAIQFGISLWNDFGASLTLESFFISVLYSNNLATRGPK